MDYQLRACHHWFLQGLCSRLAQTSLPLFDSHSVVLPLPARHRPMCLTEWMSGLTYAEFLCSAPRRLVRSACTLRAGVVLSVSSAPLLCVALCPCRSEHLFCHSCVTANCCGDRHVQHHISVLATLRTGLEPPASSAMRIKDLVQSPPLIQGHGCLRLHPCDH